MVHIVRRYGLVGGMESYVWELTHALVKLGINIEVVCEKVFDTPDPAIQIHMVKADKSSSRWRAMQGFRVRTNEVIRKSFADQNTIIHSHERCINHHVSTFHGPPMEPKTEWWRFSGLSRRINAWKAMEKDEVLGSRTQVILPVSGKIHDQLIRRYPKLADKHLAIAYPGVHETEYRPRAYRNNKKTKGNFVFVGKEWKRKGLRYAIKVIESYASQFDDCTLDVYGPLESELPSSIKQHPKTNIKGWSQEIPWKEYDALIHPATNEPFGMVVPEARAHGIPVLTTDVVGSAELEFDGVITLELYNSSEIWAQKLHNLKTKTSNLQREIKWTWKNLALQHLNEIYPLVVFPENQND